MVFYFIVMVLQLAFNQTQHDELGRIGDIVISMVAGVLGSLPNSFNLSTF